MPNLPKRKYLQHGIPEWVDTSDAWFITICCKKRHVNSLAIDTAAECIFETLKARESMGQVHVISCVIMPDHLHLVARWNHMTGMSQSIQSIKRYISRHVGIHWQNGFFDHRIRSDKLLRETIDYVRMNPVRAGLVKTADEWPYRWKRQGAFR